MRKLIAVLVFCVALLPGASVHSKDSGPAPAAVMAPLQAEAFRDDVIRFVRATASHLVLEQADPADDLLDQRWTRPYRTKRWGLRVSVYHQGQVIGSGSAIAPTMASA